MAENVVQPCKWESCTIKCSSDQALYEHLLKDHTAPWRKPGVEKLACGWADCKTEPHRRWLTQHLISHTEHRPFVCGVSTCSQGYKTRFTLEKHIKDRHSGPTLPARTSLASTTSSTPITRPKKLKAPLQLACQWKDCSATFADPPTLLIHLLISHLPKSHNSKPVNYGVPQTFLNTTDMPADVFVAATGPVTKKRKSKGDVQKEGDAKRLRVDVDDSDDEQPLAKQLRALLVTEPDGDEDDIAYSDDVKDTDYSPTKAADSEDEELNIAYEDEDEDGTDRTPIPSRSPSVITASSTAVVTPELEDEQDSSMSIATGPTAADERLNAAEQRVKTSPNPSSKARSVTASSTAVVTPEHEKEQDSSKPNATNPNAADERAAVEMRIQTLEQKLDAALNVIRQSEVLRAEWIGRMSDSADTDELEEEWNAGTAVETTTTMTEEEDEPDDWSLWVMGAL